MVVQRSAGQEMAVKIRDPMKGAEKKYPMKVVKNPLRKVLTSSVRWLDPLKVVQAEGGSRTGTSARTEKTHHNAR